MVMTSCLVLLALALCCLHGDAYVTHVGVSLDAEEALWYSDHSFTRIDVDLNKGAGGDFIYLWFRTGNSPGITNLHLTFDKSSTAPDYYTKIDKDLNAGAGGDWIYLWYTGVGLRTPIKDISVTINSDEERQKRATGWEKVPGDLNRGTIFGADIYIWVKR